MMKLASLQSRIFLLFLILLLCVQTLSFWNSYQANKRLEQQQLSSQRNKADVIFRTQFESRNYYLSAFSETVARDFGLIDNLEGERNSFLAALNNHRKRIDADIAMSISLDGIIIGQLVNVLNDSGQKKTAIGAEQDKEFRYPHWLTVADSSQFYQLGQQVYQLKLAPIKNGATVIGWIGFGYLIDHILAQQFLALTGFETVFGYAKDEQLQLLASSNITMTDETLTYLEMLITKHVSDSHYIELVKKIGELDAVPVYAIMYQSRSDLLSTLGQFWLQLAFIITISLTLSGIGAFAIARSITTPIKQLIEQAKYIAKGNYESKVSVGNSQEMQALAVEFTVMQQAVLSREKAIAHRAYHDPLTNLPNRNQLILTLNQMIAVSHDIYALLLVNIRRLTDVNDTLGHHVGDEVIKEVGNRLHSLSNIDLVCHLSGDEFVLLLTKCEKKDIKPIMDSIAATLNRPYLHDKISLHLQLSIGVAFNDLAKDPVTLLQKADTAMHQSKRLKLPYQIYDKELDTNSIERLLLVNQLRAAIENNELVLHYQPKLDLKSGVVTHVEALVRWQHPQNGLIPPDVFIGIAEQTGQMNALTHWVLNEAARQYKSWLKQDVKLAIAVNISAENFKDPNFCSFVLSLVNDNNLPLDAIILEITEDAVVEDTQLAIEILRYLRGHGLKLSIDDYGTGYSSLGQLKQLPVHELKIDRSFVQHLMTQPEDKIIVESTINLAHKLGLTVVAEGIEDEATLVWLKDNGCEMAQGFFISRPLPAHQLSQWLLTCPYQKTSKVRNLREV